MNAVVRGRVLTRQALQKFRFLLLQIHFSLTKIFHGLKIGNFMLPPYSPHKNSLIVHVPHVSPPLSPFPSATFLSEAVVLWGIVSSSTEARFSPYRSLDFQKKMFDV